MELFVTDINNKTNQVSLDLSDSRLQGFQNVGEYEFPQGEIAIKITAPAGQGMLRFSAARFTKLSAPTEEPTATPVPEAGPKVPVIDSDEYIVSIKSETDPKWNDGFFEISGFWSGSTKSEEGIHYQDPVTGKTLGRF